MLRLPTIDTRRISTKPRTLVLCFDGTTNVYDDTNTNVVELFSLLKRNNREEQMVYYQPGVGTYVPPGILLPITLKLAKMVDQGIALYLDKHVMGGYEFLMKHYNDGDKICLFGFSRGAYTARALGGMLHKVGLLPPDNVEQIPFAYQIYRRSDKADPRESAGFKETFSRDVEIEFMGVWDTVSSVGVLIPRHLPFTKFNPIVRTFRHAVSLDERRAKFKHHLWYTPLDSQHVKATGGQESTKTAEPKFLSPTVQTLSPIAALRPASKLRGSNLKEVTVPPTNDETSPDTAVDRSPLWTGGRADAISSAGAHGQTLGTSLQPKEQIHDVEKGISQDPGASDAGRVDASSDATKSEVSLASGATSERDDVASELNNETHILSRFSRWVADRKRRRTDSSGAAPLEASRSRKDKRRKDWDTNVLEVWFAGGHGDVGGGAEKNEEPYKLSNVSLRWMIQQIHSSRCGIKFDLGALKKKNISLEPVGSSLRTPASYNPPASAKPDAALQQERMDELARIHDNLNNPLWWVLEIVPRVHKCRDAKGDRHIKVTSPNFFDGRRPHTFNRKIYIHRSVQRRINNGNPPRYKFKAHIAEEDIEWVD